MQDVVSSGRLVEVDSANRDSHLDLLASRAAQGDSLAFEDIYLETVDDIYRYLVGHCGDATQAEDLASNVFLKAWKRAASYHSGSNHYRRWLFAIARNELRDSWRREVRTDGLVPFDIDVEADATATDDAEFAREKVVRALKVLTEEQRQVVILRFFSEQSHAEIARVLNKREGAVRVQLLRALRHMRKVMENAAP